VVEASNVVDPKTCCLQRVHEPTAVVGILFDQKAGNGTIGAHLGFLLLVVVSEL